MTTVQLFAEPDAINFGDLPEEINAILQQGVAAYRRDRERADKLFRKALELGPRELPVYYCLYKIHTYQGNLDEAQAVAERGFEEAARQAGLTPDWRSWQPEPSLLEGAGRFALYTLKALSFIHLKQDNRPQAREILEKLNQLDPAGSVGWHVIAALADGLA